MLERFELIGNEQHKQTYESKYRINIWDSYDQCWFIALPYDLIAWITLGNLPFVLVTNYVSQTKMKRAIIKTIDLVHSEIGTWSEIYCSYTIKESVLALKPQRTEKSEISFIYLLAIQNWNFWTLKWWRENISKIWRLRWRSGTATKELRSSGASGRASTTSQWLGRRVVFCSLSWGSIPNDRSPGQAGSTSSLSTCWAKYT